MKRFRVWFSDGQYAIYSGASEAYIRRMGRIAAAHMGLTVVRVEVVG